MSCCGVSVCVVGDGDGDDDGNGNDDDDDHTVNSQFVKMQHNRSCGMSKIYLSLFIPFDWLAFVQCCAVR